MRSQAGWLIVPQPRPWRVSDVPFLCSFFATWFTSAMSERRQLRVVQSSAEAAAGVKERASTVNAAKVIL
jgi:hypothetical protein